MNDLEQKLAAMAALAEKRLKQLRRAHQCLLTHYTPVRGKHSNFPFMTNKTFWPKPFPFDQIPAHNHLNVF